MLAQQHLIPPLLAELTTATAHNEAWLLPYLCASLPLAQALIPTLIQTMQHLLPAVNSGSCGEDQWSTLSSISLAMLKVVRQLEGAESMALSATSMRSLVSLCVQAAYSSSTCYRKEVSEWVELVAHVLSSCAKHADARYNNMHVHACCLVYMHAAMYMYPCVHALALCVMCAGGVMTPWRLS